MAASTLSFAMRQHAAIAQDLRAACLHEYGHAVIAERFGVPGVVEISRNVAGGVEQSHWCGRCRLYGKAHQRAMRVIGLAGTLAEQFAAMATVDPFELHDFLSCGVIELSETDAALAADFRVSDVRRCLRLVARSWSSIAERATLREKYLLHELRCLT